MIRFKKDDGAAYPEVIQKKVMDIADTYIGLVTTMTEHYVRTGVPLIRNSDIKENRFVFRDHIFLDEEFATKNKSRKHQLGDIITVHTGDVGTSAVIDKNLDGSIGFATIVTRLNDKQKNVPEYLCWYFNSPKNKRIITNMITGDGRNNLNMKDFNKLVVPNPCTEEQQKIADFLSSVDEIITASEQEIANLEERKKGAMQKIFSQEVRFKADDGSEYPAWEEKRLGDVANIVGGGTPNTEKEEYWNGDIQWFTPSEIGKSKFVNYSIRTITQAGLDNSSAKLLPINTILLSTRATLGEMSIAKRKCCTNQGFQSLIIKNGVNVEYIYYLQDNIKSYCKKYSSGSTFLEISKRQLEKCKIQLPCSEEQKKIADFLSSFDEAIDLAKQELELWKEIKKGLLQQMFM